MFVFIQSQGGYGFHAGYKGALALGALLWLTLPLSGCSSSGKEYVVDYARGNDVTAQGSRELPCQTEVQCQMLAERDGVHSYWLVYQ
ncbi:MAG: hypothetical protein CV081_04055 [Nitrospira sp. LK265]|nr:hypothetical protein [Nitrospira sp.]NGZ59664.1 hypothetical protein [Nitrospira sp. LK265]